MKFTMELSVRGEAANPESIRAVARAAEQAGFDMLGYTDHPAPSGKWLAGGGHPTFDPFAGLSFVAAVTECIRLMTYLAVLPYRNPLLLAKNVATVDRLSSGRFTLVAGTGYLRSEFAALGRPFDQRNDAFDETIEVLRSVYTDDDFRYVGADFEALGVASDPKPVQLPHPPIWVGGSSAASRERVARFGDGWAPLMTSPAFARTVRTAPLSTLDDLGAAIDDLRSRVAAAGRDPGSISVHFDGLGAMDAEPDITLKQVDDLTAIGVTHALVRPPQASTTEVVEAVERFGASVIQSA